MEPFAYQTRLLERTSSRSEPRPRWTPSHRIAASLDTVRGKWEERARADTVDTPDNKRHTLPAHIVASPLSPNSTGISVENPDSPASVSASPTPHRIRLPASIPESPSDTPSSSRSRRSNTLDSSSVNYAAARQALNRVSDSPPFPSSPTSRPLLTPNASASTLHRRPTSLYATTPPDKHRHRASSALDLVPTLPPSPDRPSSRTSYSPSHSPTPSSVMSPAPFKSSYMASKKASTYGQIGARRLGRHLPRIASGDGDDAPHDHDQPSSIAPSSPQKEKPAYAHSLPPLSPVVHERVASGVADSDDVAGVPGRLRLSRDKAPNATHPSPLPSSRLTRGLWADTQRHLLQAYEYLCHVGEAQQWIEGCLGEELGFGVVEMEEGLRNGVVLAKLVRAFQGERVVRRIYEVLFHPPCHLSP